MSSSGDWGYFGSDLVFCLLVKFHELYSVQIRNETTRLVKRMCGKLYEMSARLSSHRHPNRAIYIKSLFSKGLHLVQSSQILVITQINIYKHLFDPQDIWRKHQCK
jgi:hypothetical protein